MTTKYEGDLLKDKKPDGELLQDIPEGELIRDKPDEGEPLWRNSGPINESDYRDRNLNE